MRIYLTDANEYDEISIFSRNGIEGSAGKLGISYSYLKGAYTMTKDQFEWWEELLERKAHCEEMEEKISDEETRKFLLDQCDEHDLGMRVIQYERLLMEELKERK